MHKTDWLHDAGWGVFTHYLYHAAASRSGVCATAFDDWDACGDWNSVVDSFDTDRLAKKLNDIGAKYYFITIMQRTKYMLAPNETYDRITGYAPGEACAKRDLIADLYESLSRYGIRLCLYYTGDGPMDDPQAGPRMGMVSHEVGITEEFVANWASVLREYSLRYGKKISAWWIDGCYEGIGYREKTLGMLADAARAGNPDVLVSLNCGVREKVSAYSEWDDFTTGEMDRFTDFPESRFISGAQWHTLNHVGSTWAESDTQIDGPALADYVKKVNERGGVVTLDIAIRPNGDLYDEQLGVLKALKKTQ